MTVGTEIAVTAETMTEAELVTTVETVEAGPVVVRVRVVTVGTNAGLETPVVVVGADL